MPKSSIVATNRGAYQRIVSLTDYLRVAQSTVRIEHHPCPSYGSWRYRFLEAGGSIVLTHGARLSVDDIYVEAFDLAANTSN
jgi:hypothetical protein